MKKHFRKIMSIPIIKHGGGTVMVLEYFASSDYFS